MASLKIIHISVNTNPAKLLAVIVAQAELLNFYRNLEQGGAIERLSPEGNDEQAELEQAVCSAIEDALK